MLLICGIVSMTSGAKKADSRSESIEEAKNHRFEPIFQEIEGFIIEKIDEMFKEDVANGKYERSHYEDDDGTLLKDLDI